MVRINLMPREYRPQPQIRPLRLLLLLFMVLAPIAFGAVAVYGYQQIQSLQRDIEALQRERVELKPLYDKVISMERTLAAVQGKVAAMEKVSSRHMYPKEILKAMGGVVPENVVLNSLGMASSGAISISGQASDYYGVAALQLKMILSERFGGTVLSSAAGNGPIGFQLTTTYNSGPASPAVGTLGPALQPSGQTAVRPPSSAGVKQAAPEATGGGLQ